MDNLDSQQFLFEDQTNDVNVIGNKFIRSSSIRFGSKNNRINSKHFHNVCDFNDDWREKYRQTITSLLLSSSSRNMLWKIKNLKSSPRIEFDNHLQHHCFNGECESIITENVSSLSLKLILKKIALIIVMMPLIWIRAALMMMVMMMMIMMRKENLFEKKQRSLTLTNRDMKNLKTILFESDLDRERSKSSSSPLSSSFNTSSNSDSIRTNNLSSKMFEKKQIFFVKFFNDSNFNDSNDNNADKDKPNNDGRWLKLTKLK